MANGEELDKLYEYGIKLLDSISGDIGEQEKRQSELENKLDLSRNKVKEMKSYMENFFDTFSE